jgi:hypothetical protein
MLGENILIMRKLSVVLLAILIALLTGSDAMALKIPERLEYDLTWMGILAGRATLKVEDSGEDILFKSRAVSSPAVSVFYKVEDIAVSSLKKGKHKTLPGILYNYRVRQSEGRHRKDREVVFDLKGKKATHIDHLEKNRKEYEIGSNTMDALTCFYHVRFLPLEPGKPVYARIFDNRKYYRLEVQVLNRAQITTSLGTFNTILIKPILRTEGLFQRKGDVLIWLTDDERRLPVLLETKVKIGSIKATLTGGNY